MLYGFEVRDLILVFGSVVYVGEMKEEEDEIERLLKEVEGRRMRSSDSADVAVAQGQKKLVTVCGWANEPKFSVESDDDNDDDRDRSSRGAS